MKKIILILGFIAVLSIPKVNATEYRTAFGVRGGFYSGLTLKHFMSGMDALEIVAATHHRGILLAGMYQRHAQAFDVPGLNWYFGGGGHLGFYDRRYSPWFGSHQTGNLSTLGVIGVVGIEYKIEEIPVTVGVDVTPAFNLIGHTGFWINSGLVLRYTFN